MSLRIDQVGGGVTSDLRREVLRPAWAPGTAMPGDDDPQALHLAAFDGDEVVGACVALPRPYPATAAHETSPPETVGDSWQLRGMAVAENRRGTGIGGLLVDALLDALRARDVSLVWCEARVVAVRLYLRHGFVIDGPEYAHHETGRPHHLMWRTLTA